MKYPDFEHFIVICQIAFAFRIQTLITMNRESLWHLLSHVFRARRRKGDEKEAGREKNTIEAWNKNS